MIRVDCYGDELEPVVWLNIDGSAYSLTPDQARGLSVKLGALAEVVDGPPVSLFEVAS